MRKAAKPYGTARLAEGADALAADEILLHALLTREDLDQANQTR